MSSTGSANSARPPATRFARGPAGDRIAYAVHGDGPVLFCPPWWISQVESDWDDPHFRAFFAALGESFTVVRYDQPGVGLSDHGRTVASLDEAVATMEAVVDAVGISQMSVFGLSAGGPVGLAYAARWPERVERIALFGTFVRGTDIGTRAVRDAVLQLVQAHWGLGSQTLTDIFVPGAAPEVAARFKQRQRRCADAQTAHDLLEFLFGLDATDVAARVRCPTLVAHRRGDRAIPFEAGRRLAAAVPTAELVSMEGRIHLPWEEGDDLLTELHEFLGASPIPGADRPCWVDAATRELVVAGERSPLTPLEYGVLTHLISAHGAVVTRDELLREVWQQAYGGSNVVDAVVASLRKKLGDRAGAIETVVGHGYRFRDLAPPTD